MTFLVQFIRFRRGVPEVVRTLPIAAADGIAALEHVKGRVGTGSWPMNADALRVMGDARCSIGSCPFPPGSRLLQANCLSEYGPNLIREPLNTQHLRTGRNKGRKSPQARIL